MKKLVIAAVAAIALTASVSFVSCNAKDVAALDSLANALDSAATELEEIVDTLNTIDSTAVDSIAE
ncbi:MAG: hypothetical protein KBT33_03190 [Prevotellaceae bacterium]|nr:hypothetical protein [Candidatus Minthosoma equi]